jgi:hypothetical protein
MRDEARMSEQPLAIDLFCGLGGWTEGLLAEGYRVVGFDIERHVYGEARYPAQMVLQDVLTLHGSQFKDAALIVASPPCQEFSYMAMPWTRAKQIAKEYREGTRDVSRLTALFDACFRIQREAIEAAGHHIPLIVENVRGIQPWVGRARWNYGSFYLYGDVPALMPIVRKHVKVPTMGAGWYPPDHPKHVPGLAFNGHADRNLRDGVKAGDRNKARASGGHEWTTGFDKHIAHNTTSGHGQNPDGRLDGVKGSEGYERTHPNALGWKKPNTSSHSNARKAASAQIAKIPLPLSRHIASAWKPDTEVTR